MFEELYKDKKILEYYKNAHFFEKRDFQKRYNMKNILFVPQIANRSYTTGKWILMKDGHIRMIKNQIQALNKFGEFSFSIMLPGLDSVEDVKQYSEIFYEDIFSNLNIRIVEVDMSKNVAYNRFHFDMNYLLKHENIFFTFDYIFTDVPETARNFQMFYKLNKKEIKIIANVHYLDIYPENKIDPNGDSNYFWRQFDGVTCADKATFLTLKYADDFFDYAGDRLYPEVLEQLEKKCYVLDYMCISEYELNMYKKVKNPNKQIFFISRCSDDKRTKWKEFIECVKELRKVRTDFEVFIANPTQINTKILKDIIGDSDFIKYSEVPLNRREYIEKLWESHCVPLLYDIENNLSVGFYEAIYCRNIPVQFNVDYESDKNGSVKYNLLTALKKSLDSSPDEFLERRVKIIKDHSCEQNAERFFHDFI